MPAELDNSTRPVASEDSPRPVGLAQKSHESSMPEVATRDKEGCESHQGWTKKDREWGLAAASKTGKK